jgi:hypothetical protein
MGPILPNEKGTPFRAYPCSRSSGTSFPAPLQSSGTSNSATMLMILISGLIAGPAVSL